MIDATIADMHEIPDATVSDEFEAEEPPLPLVMPATAE